MINRKDRAKQHRAMADQMKDSINKSADVAVTAIKATQRVLTALKPMFKILISVIGIVSLVGQAI